MEFPLKTLNLLADVIARPLAFVINQSLFHGKFPDAFKSAKVVPVCKKGDHDCTDNYRPISLLNNLIINN